MKHFKIGGVPEHFNLPWYFTLRDKAYPAQGINLRWKDYPGGTGDMCAALRKKEIDMAVLLTEGMVRDIINGNNSSIVQVFVETPLLWGIHVAKNSRFHSVSDLKGTVAAISRFGSGSHLMAFVNAENHKWNTQADLHFKEVKDLEGALENLPKGESDYFMWEKFMTKPYVDRDILRLVGECPTPWPCFVIAVRNEMLETETESIKTILEIINATTADFKDITSIDTTIAHRYNLRPEDVKQWLSLTRWSQRPLTEKELERIQNELLNLALIDQKIPANKIIATL